MSVAQSVARPVRTGTQLVAAAVIVEFVDSFFIDLTDRQYAAAVGLVTMLVSFLQVVLENRAGKGFLRTPEPPERPVEVVQEGGVQVNERGAFDSGILITIAAVVVIIAGIIFIVQAL